MKPKNAYINYKSNCNAVELCLSNLFLAQTIRPPDSYMYCIGVRAVI